MYSYRQGKTAPLLAYLIVRSFNLSMDPMTDKKIYNFKISGFLIMTFNK